MMKSSLPLLVTLLLVAGCREPAEQHEESHADWAYSGTSGPEHWAESYPECGLEGESPIDISNAHEADLAPLEFSYDAVRGRVRDTGHAIQVDTDGGQLQVGDSTYTLRQLHFHIPSEHTIDGRQFDAVIHLVHTDSSGRIAVVGVPITAGAENAFLEDVLTQTESAAEVEVRDVLPADHAYFTYAGSLTTPPCTRGVTWYVMEDSIEVSTSQIDRLGGYYRDNARPVQPITGRTILRSTHDAR